jgi:hypothetical protein
MSSPIDTRGSRSKAPASSGEGPGNRSQPASGGSGLRSALVQVESLTQLALILPAATFIGWIAGVGLDRWLHQHWLYIAGLILGAAAGFVQIFRTVAALGKE